MTDKIHPLTVLIAKLEDDYQFHGEIGNPVVSYERQRDAIRYLKELEAAQSIIKHYQQMARTIRSSGFVDIASNFEKVVKNTQTYETVIIEHQQKRLHESLSKRLDEELEKLATEHGTTKAEILDHARALLEKIPHKKAEKTRNSPETDRDDE